MTVEPTPNTAQALSLVRGCDNPPRLQPMMSISGEGRVVLAIGSWSVRQLSAAGLARIRQEVLAAPLLQTSAEHLLERLPADSSGIVGVPVHGMCTYTFTLGTGPAAVVVRSTSWNGDSEEAQFYMPSPERKELDRLANRLASVADWVTADGWSDAAWSPFASASFLLWVESLAGPAPDGIPSAAGVTWPFAGAIEAFGDATGPGRCGYLQPTAASDTVRLLRGAGVDARLDAATYVTGLRTDAGWVKILLTPRAPDGFPTCADEAQFQY
jgi:hypothetical protein